MNYTTAVKNARMNAITTAIGAAGVIEIGTAAMAAILATLPLANPAAPGAAGGVLTFTMPQSDTSADNSGKAYAARVRTASGGTDIVTALTVGLNSTAAPAWAATTVYPLGAYRTNGANIYKCVTAGTSAGSGGPTGTGSGITDGSVTWDFYCPAGADVQLDSLEITAGQTVTLNSATITHAA